MHRLSILLIKRYCKRYLKQCFIVVKTMKSSNLVVDDHETPNPAKNYIFDNNNVNTSKTREICSTLTIKGYSFNWAKYS